MEYWYLGTPYSKYPHGPDEAFREACRAAGYLIRQGIGVFCSIAHTHPIAVECDMSLFDHDLWLPEDEPMMRGAVGMIVCQMVSWEESYGLRKEIEHFEEAGKPIFYWDWPAAKVISEIFESREDTSYTGSMVIGLCGYPGAGKDTAAEALVEDGWTQISFADPLRLMLLALDPIVPVAREGYKSLSYCIKRFGWDWSKRNIPEIRGLLQRLGTECVREHIGENTWVELARKKIGESIGNVVITDCRFPQEFEMVKELGGILVYIERPGFETPNGHVSEQNYGTTKFDYILHNSGYVEELHQNIRGIANGETPF